jgi:hypothetical protein
VGEHDLVSRGAVEDAFAHIQAAGTTVVIDLLEVTFVDWSPIGRNQAWICLNSSHCGAGTALDCMSGVQGSASPSTRPPQHRRQ